MPFKTLALALAFAAVPSSVQIEYLAIPCGSGSSIVITATNIPCSDGAGHSAAQAESVAEFTLRQTILSQLKAGCEPCLDSSEQSVECNERVAWDPEDQTTWSHTGPSPGVFIGHSCLEIDAIVTINCGLPEDCISA